MMSYLKDSNLLTKEVFDQSHIRKIGLILGHSFLKILLERRSLNLLFRIDQEIEVTFSTKMLPDHTLIKFRLQYFFENAWQSVSIQKFDNILHYFRHPINNCELIHTLWKMPLMVFRGKRDKTFFGLRDTRFALKL